MSIKAFSDYMTFEKHASPHTLRAYFDDISAFEKFCIVEHQLKSIDQVSYSFIRMWVVSLVDVGISNRTINRKVSSLKAYFKFLLKIKQITESPFRKHQPLKVPKNVQIPFSEKEMRDCLDGISFGNMFEGRRDKLVIELLYATGMRRSELVGIKISDINFQDSLIKVLGKRSKERLIPITKMSVELLLEYLKTRKAPNTEALFVTKRGSPFTSSQAYRIVTKYMKQVSSKTKVSPHILRHTTATHVLNNGANINDVKELLGHTSLMATQIYTHNSIFELKKQYKKAHPRSLNT